MKKQEKCSDFSHRRSYLKHAWCVLLAVLLPTAGNVLRAEEGSRLPENTHSAPNGSVLPVNTVAGSTNASVPASKNGLVSSSTGTAVQDAEANSPSAASTQAVASDTMSSVGTSASGRPVVNAISPSQASVLPTKTAPTNTSSGVSPSTGSATGSNATVATASGATTVPATDSGVATATTTSTATTLTATGAPISASPATGTITSATGSVSTDPDTANSSQTPSAPVNIALGATASSDANGAAPTQEEEPQDLGDILDLRPPAKLKVSLLPWVIALLIILSAIGLWFLLKRKRHGKAKKEKPTKPIDPYEAVLQALKEASKKLDVANPKPFAFFLTDAVRLYLSRIFRLPAPECTTQELLQQLPWCTELTDDLRTNITQFLQRCDLVKFTTMPFDEPFLLQLYQQAEAIVAASHELTKTKPTPVATNVAPSSNPKKTPKK